ncbi:class I tRNA ligase family protein [Acinetobacter baumannii]|uniref:class I tRNA ligase family protein n=1 Tax=Acinetobacter baumannii TaxID=470 RepID=UPI0021AF0621|nr:class I tRNA ligase family protein [Acinetobacter baumannii]MCT2436752.1 class I tRNA ligase family protein [Acinetobacter baumannii]
MVVPIFFINVYGIQTAPYKALLTHGFTVDENGRKLSKSLGNYIPLEEIIKHLVPMVYVYM